MISGRVPTIVMTFIVVSDLKREGVRPVAIEDFRRPEQCHELAISDVRDRVRVAWRDINDSKVGAPHRKLNGFPALAGPHPNDRAALDDHELLGLRVVKVIATGNPRLGARDEELSEMW